MLRKRSKYYKNALGAVEVSRLLGPDGKLARRLMIGDSTMFLTDEPPQHDIPQP